MNLRHAALVLAMVLATQAQANTTYTLVDYPADQNGATVSGYFTLRPGSGDISADDVLDWSVTLSQAGVSFTTGMSDPSASLQPIGAITRTPTEITIAPGAGWLWIESSDVSLSYSRNPDQYSGQGGNTIGWQATTLGETEPWVIARTLAIAVPEPSSFVMLGATMVGLGVWRGRGAS